MSTTEPPYDAGTPISGQSGSGTDAANKSRRHGRGDTNPDGVFRTRIGRAWVGVGTAVVLGVALVDFIVQNTRSVRIEFFSASGQMPVAVALIGAALAGAFIVLAVGIARTTQLRLANRRGRKRQKQTEALVPGADD